MKAIGDFQVITAPRTCSRCGGEFRAFGREYICPRCKDPEPKPAVEPGAYSFEQLSPRERQIYDMVGRCLPNKEIAWQLKLTTGTVKEYMFHLQQKIGLTRYQMIREQALEEGRQAAACSLPCPLAPANEPQF